MPRKAAVLLYEARVFAAHAPVGWVGMTAAVGEWLDALERRHLSVLTFSEAARALRALSSWYVERRSKLSSGIALETRGKRAAFALFYGPLHFFLLERIVQSLGEQARVTRIVDVGCGTGAAGAAWAMTAGARRVDGVDRHPWAVTESNWTYRRLRLSGRAVQGNLARFRGPARSDTGLLAAYVVNEVPQRTRDELLARLHALRDAGSPVLIVEPIARRVTPWWNAWEEAVRRRGGRADEWRFRVELPHLQARLARAAGLDPRELTARSLWW